MFQAFLYGSAFTLITAVKVTDHRGYLIDDHGAAAHAIEKPPSTPICVDVWREVALEQCVKRKPMTVGDPRTWMWAQALAILDEADRFHRHFFEPGRSAADQPCWQPPVDIIETDDDYWILVALPGVSPQRVRATIEGGSLVLQGERPMPAKSFPGAIKRLEIPYGRFERRVPIPSGRFEVREQRFENGCLVVGLRRLA